MPKTTHCVEEWWNVFAIICMSQVKTSCFLFIHIHVGVSVKKGLSESSQHFTRQQCLGDGFKMNAINHQTSKPLKMISIIIREEGFGSPKLPDTAASNHLLLNFTSSSNKSTDQNFTFHKYTISNIYHLNPSFSRQLNLIFCKKDKA